MKKYFLVFTLFLVFIKGFSQEKYSYFLANEFIKQIEGTIVAEESDNGSYTITVEVSDIYSEDLIKTEVSRVMRKYKDIEIFSPWRRESYGIIIGLSIDIKGEGFAPVAIAYSKAKNIIVLSFSSKDLIPNGNTHRAQGI